MTPSAAAPIKAMELFDAFARGRLPENSGCIVTSRFSLPDAYASYEILSYRDLVSTLAGPDSLSFTAHGSLLFILVEPESYPRRALDPDRRPARERIACRLDELEKIAWANRTSIYLSNQARDTGDSFTIARPIAMDFSILFFPQPEMLETLRTFFENSFSKEAGIPIPQAKEAAAKIAESFRSLPTRG